MFEFKQHVKKKSKNIKTDIRYTMYDLQTQGCLNIQL